MNDSTVATPVYDRTIEDLGNIVELGHVNVTVPDQYLATLFYISGLGLTRDPYLNTGVENMWANAGRAQFHLPARSAQILRGVTGLVLPDLHALRHRLSHVAPHLKETKFAFREAEDAIETTCPWGNRIRCHGPDTKRFGPVVLGMPYVEFGVPPGSLDGIVTFYREILGALSGIAADAGGPYAWTAVGDGQRLIFRESREDPGSFDGHHIQITLVDFSGPHRKLLERGLITREDDQHQYRFQDVVDPASNKVLFTIEHEVRSMRHPLYGRPLVNRNPAQTNRHYAAGHDAAPWSMPLS